MLKRYGEGNDTKTITVGALRGILHAYYYGEDEEIEPTPSPKPPIPTCVEAGMEFVKERRKYRVVGIGPQHFWVEDECGGHGTWTNEDIPHYNPATPVPKVGDIVYHMLERLTGMVDDINCYTNPISYQVCFGSRSEWLWAERDEFRIVFRPGIGTQKGSE